MVDRGHMAEPTRFYLESHLTDVHVFVFTHTNGTCTSFDNNYTTFVR